MKLKWLPIESAPKDGTQIILYEHSRGPAGDYFTVVVGEWMGVENGLFHKWWSPEKGIENPTHWTPIPEFEE